MRHIRPVIVGGVAVAVLAAIAVGQAPNAQIVRYVSMKPGRHDNRPAMEVIVCPPAGGETFSVILPSQRPTQLQVKPELLLALSKLKGGELIEIAGTKSMGRLVVTAVSAYKLKPGEDEAQTWTLVTAEHRVGEQDALVFTVRKWDKTLTLIASSTQDAAGNWVRDPAVASAKEKLKPGDIVEVSYEESAGKNILKEIRAWQPPVRGQFLRSREQRQGEATLLIVTIKQGGAELVCQLPGRKDSRGLLVPDPDMSETVKKLKPDQAVEFKTHQEGDAQVLHLLRAAPK